MRYLLALTLATLACPVLADDFSATEAKIKAALKNDRRSEAETTRRIQDDVRWEHDRGLPDWYGELPSIIAAVYNRSKSKG